VALSVPLIRYAGTFIQQCHKSVIVPCSERSRTALKPPFFSPYRFEKRHQIHLGNSLSAKNTLTMNPLTTVQEIES
jgi:hypothetical protein